MPPRPSSTLPSNSELAALFQRIVMPVVGCIIVPELVVFDKLMKSGFRFGKGFPCVGDDGCGAGMNRIVN